MPSNAARLDPIRRETPHEESIRRDADAATAPLRVEVFDTLAAARAFWRELERDAVLTPYQRFDWISALVDARGLDGARCAISVIHAGERPIALLPFEIRRRLGVRMAGIIGADISNADWPVLRPETASRLTPEALGQVFSAIGRKAGGLDMICLLNQPESWMNRPNPLLAFAHQPAPDHLHLGPIGPGGAPFLSGRRIRNIQRGRRRLEEAMGPVVLRRADRAEEITRVHAVFLAQRGARFARMGVRNVFAEDWFIDFFRRAAVTAPGSDRPALRFDALYAGDEIVATSCGACAGTHYSQYINSTAMGPAAKYSLMGILMHDLVAELAAAGFTSIDMGLGDFDYKSDWTDKRAVFDSVIPLTAAGRLAAPLVLGLRRLKRAVKQNDTLFGMFRRLRSATLPRSSHPPDSPSRPDGAG